jgi:methylenetetrahydrofolate reductase (NADPH)
VSTNTKQTTFSLEIFPPKPDSPRDGIYRTLDGLSGISPDFISVTYGAGGSNNGAETIRIAADIVSRYGFNSMAHLPCVGLTRERAGEILGSLEERGITSVLALRGDIPENSGIVRGDFPHASDLIGFIRENFPSLSVFAACYPEVHPESADAQEDIKWLAHKVRSGADCLITQFFLDNRHFYDFRDRARSAGIEVPIEAGIMPVTNKKQIERMVKICQVELPAKFVRVLDRYGDNPEALRDAGIAYAADQITDLIAEGVDGIHLYTMNSPYTACKIFDAIHSML